MRFPWLLPICGLLLAGAACGKSREPPYKVHLALAEERIGKGDTAGAVAQFKEALEAKENLPALLGLAQLHMAAQRWPQAGEALERARLVFPESPRARLGAGDLALAQGDLKAAHANYGGALEREPKHLGILLRWAALAKGEEQRNQALAKLEAFEPHKGATAPKELHLVVAALMAAQGHVEASRGAQQLAEAAHTVGPDRAVQVARIYLALGQLSVAEALIEVATHQPYVSPDVWLLLVRVAAELDHDELARSSYQSAVAAEKLRPTGVLDGPEARLLAARVDMLAGRHRSALQTLTALERSAPNSPRPGFSERLAYWLGMAHIHLGDREAGTKRLEAQLPQAVHYARAQLVLSQLSLDAKDVIGGQRRLEALVKTKPRLAAAYTKLAFMLRDADQLLQAESVLQDGIKLMPNRAVLWLAMARIYTTMGRPTRMATALEQAHLHDPSHVATLSALADLRFRQGRTQDAIALYERAILLRPTELGALNNLAFLYADSEAKLERAHEVAARALALAPEHPSVMDTMGWVLLRRGHHEQAVDYLQKAQAKAPADPQVHYHLGAALIKSGERERGRRALRKALAMGDQFAGADAARDLLAQD